MNTYEIKYVKQATGILWWKKSEWVWALYEERMVDISRPDAWYADMQPRSFILEVSKSKPYLESTMERLVQGASFKESVS
jgi:hypothetical protein